MWLWDWTAPKWCCGNIRKQASVTIAEAARRSAKEQAPGSPIASQRAVREALTPRHFVPQPVEDAAGVGPEERLLAAARAGNLKRMAQAITESGDIHFVTARGQTLLMLAAASTSPTALQAVAFLLDAHAALEVRDEAGWTALHHACRNSNPDIVSLCIERRSSMNACTLRGETAVILAAMDGHVEMVRLLLGLKASVGKRDSMGKTALYHACEIGQTDLVKFLLRSSAKPNVRATDGMAPIMLGIKAQKPNIVQMLMVRQADLNACDSKGENALMYLLRYLPTRDMLSLFLEEKIDLDHENKKGQNVLHIAKQLGLAKIQEIIAKSMGMIGTVGADDDDD